MMERRILPRIAVVLAAVLVLLAGGCSPAGQGAFQLDYRVQGGIAGFDTRFLTGQSGHFTMTERGKTVNEGSLAAAEVESLRTYLARVPWDTLQPSYDAAPQVRDDLTYVITTAEGGKTRTVAVAGTAQPPQEVRDLIAFLEGLRQSHRAAAGSGATPDTGTGGTAAKPPATATLSDTRDGFLAYASESEQAVYWQSAGGSPQRLARFQDLPESFTPQGATPDIQFGVSPARFTALALAPGGNRVAFATMGTHGFLAVVDAPSGSNTGGHLFPLDLGFETSYQRLFWSPDGRYLAVLANPPSGAQASYVYDVQANARLDSTWPELRRLLPPEDYSIYPIRWDSPVALRLRVAAGPSGNGNSSRHGEWVLDVTNGSLTQVAPQ